MFWNPPTPSRDSRLTNVIARKLVSLSSPPPPPVEFSNEILVPPANPAWRSTYRSASSARYVEWLHKYCKKENPRRTLCQPAILTRTTSGCLPSGAPPRRLPLRWTLPSVTLACRPTALSRNVIPSPNT